MKIGRRVVWLLLGILLLAVVFSPAPGYTRWVRTLHNAAHGPIFGCVAVLFLLILRAHPRSSSLGTMPQYLISSVLTTLLGAITEVLQGFIGRDASFSDALHDVLGAVTFLALFSVFDPRLRDHSSRTRVAAFGVAVFLFAFLAAPVVRSAAEYRRRADHFPVIVDFQHGLNRYFLGHSQTLIERVAMPAPWARDAHEPALHVFFFDSRYPGISVRETHGDWKGYSALVIDIANPTSMPLELTIRIDDVHHNERLDDRFNKRYLVPTGTRRPIRIPLSEIEAGPKKRLLDLRNVRSIVMFRSKGCRAGEMYLSRIWLE